MPTRKMHATELEIDAGLVGRLLAAQFPQWADWPIDRWGLLPREVHRASRDELGVDDATWRRGRGWALAVGLIGIPYYEVTNPHFAAMGRYLVDEVLRDE